MWNNRKLEFAQKCAKHDGQHLWAKVLTLTFSNAAHNCQQIFIKVAEHSMENQMTDTKTQASASVDPETYLQYTDSIASITILGTQILA